MEETLKQLIFENFCKSDGTHYESAAKEITDHVYKFNKWCISNAFYQVFEDDFGVIDLDLHFKTIEDLYKFWRNNTEQK
jgi:hypothetical protein